MKKLLALILAASMILCLVPAAGAEASSDESYDYIFNNTVFSTFAETPKATQTMGANHTVENCLPKAVCGSDPWGFVASTTSRGNTSTMESESRFSFYLNATDSADRPDRTADYGEVINNGDGTFSYKVLRYDTENPNSWRALTLELDVLSAGVFNPVFNYRSDTGTDDSIIEFFLINKEDCKYDPKSGYGSFLKNLDARDRIGVVDMFSAEKILNNSATLPAVTLSKAGKYYLVMLVNGTNKNFVPTRKGAVDVNGNDIAYSYMEFYSFHLKRKTEAALGTAYNYNFTTDALNIDSRDNENYPDAATDGKLYLISTPGNVSTAGVIADRAANPPAKGADSNNWQWKGMVATTDVNLQYLKPEKTDPWNVMAMINYNNGYVGKGELFANAAAGRYVPGTYARIGIMLNVPSSGVYDFSLNAKKSATGSDLYVYFMSESEISNPLNPPMSEYEKDKLLVGTYDTYNEAGGAKTLGSVNVPAAGKYYVVLELRKASGIADAGYYDMSVSNIKLTKTAHADDGTAEKIAKQYLSPENAFAENIDISGVEVIASLEDLDGASLGNISGTVVDNIATIEAPEIEGYKFLEWDNAACETVCDTASYSFKISESTKLTAFYYPTGYDSVLVSFYNGNGENLLRLDVDRNSEITLPPLPSMTGYSTAEKWICANDSAEYDAGAKLTATGSRMTFVAKYSEDDAVSGIKVKINGATSTYSYGELVTATAAARDEEDGTVAFAYWTKDGEIVSFDKTYSFNAWEDCELESVYETFVPLATEVRKILLGEVAADILGSRHVMAEFIGCEDAIERGIIFGDASTITLGGESVAKATAKTDKKQFTASYVAGSYARGYAIFKNGSATEIIYSDAK